MSIDHRTHRRAGTSLVTLAAAVAAYASALYMDQAEAAPPDAMQLSGGSSGRTQEVQVQVGSSSTAGRTNGTAVQSTQVQSNRLDATDLLVAQLWGLSTDEMTRAKALMQGPRAAFSVSNLSPVEALGIHARSEAERRKYAEMFARALHDDVKRTLAFQGAFQEAMTRLYGNEPVVDFSRVPRVAAPVGAADAANVPRSVIIDVAPSAGGPSATRNAKGAGK